MFFKSRPLVEDDLRHWITEEFAFAIEEGILRKDTPLILPTRDFFTAPGGKSPEVVQALVHDLQRLLQIEDAEIHVAPLNRVRAENQVIEYGKLSQVGGTWQPQEDEVGGAAVVHYDPDHLEYQPITLIATLHHELMHHVLLNEEEEPPEDMAEEELRTDLHCITSGGGVIQINGSEASGWGGVYAPAHTVLLPCAVHVSAGHSAGTGSAESLRADGEISETGPERVAKSRRSTGRTAPDIEFITASAPPGSGYQGQGGVRPGRCGGSRSRRRSLPHSRLRDSQNG